MSWLLELPLEVIALLLRAALLLVLYGFLWVVFRGILNDLKRETAVTPVERRPRLIVERSELKSLAVGTSHVLLPTNSIGRLPSCTMVLDDPHVSSRHAEIERQDGSWVVRDLDSTNGTRLNGVSVDEPMRLREGDRLEIGGLAFRFQER